MEEIWKDIKGYEGMYQISSLGRIKALERWVTRKDGRLNHYPEKIMTPKISYNGYMRIGLWKNGKVKNCLVHRLVAATFIPNPNHLPQVNHKDEDRTNNIYTNLEWCSSSYNINYGHRNDYFNIKVNQYDLDGNFIKTWDGARQAGSAIGHPATNITRCCRKRGIKTAYGYKWEYAE